MRHVVVPLVGVAALSVTVLAQSPAFEVATIKTNRSASRNSGAHIPDVGRFDATNITTQHLLMYAFSVRPSQIIGSPNWMLEDRFDIVGKPPDDAAPKSLPKMIEAMLKDRFALIAHKEMREQPIYALVLASRERKLGPALTPATCAGKECGIRTVVEDTGAGRTTATGQPMSNLATLLTSLMDRDVIDRTGLRDTYDFELRFSRDELRGGATVSDVPSIRTALQEQLGLKLEAARGPVEFIVIDSVSRPTPD